MVALYGLKKKVSFSTTVIMYYQIPLENIYPSDSWFLSMLHF